MNLEIIETQTFYTFFVVSSRTNSVFQIGAPVTSSLSVAERYGPYRL